MPMFNVKWSVTEIVNGAGEHDDGVRDKQRKVIARGEINKEGESAEALRSALTSLLEKNFPREDMGPTYNLDRVYDINITPIPS